VASGAARTFRIKLAEGVVSEPFLPSGDQDHKGGFATLPKQHPILCEITNKIQAGIRLFYNNVGCKTGGQSSNSQKLGIRLDTAKSPVLESHSFIDLSQAQPVKHNSAQQRL
jgi:hypothetical protein